MPRQSIVRSRCPRCKVRCDALKNPNPSSLCLTDGPEEIFVAFPNEDDFNLRIWSFMEPPPISRETPLVNPMQLERIRRLIDQRPKDNDRTQAHIRSKIAIEYLRDGSVVKTKSRTELRRYSATEFSQGLDGECPEEPPPPPCAPPRIICGPECTEIEEEEIEDKFRTFIQKRQVERETEEKNRKCFSQNPCNLDEE